MVELPPEVLTCTSTLPGVSVAGVRTVIDVADTTLTDVPATPPNVTDELLRKPVPVMVTSVLPTVVPDVGDNEVIAGTTDVYVKSSAVPTVDDVPAVFVTVTLTAPSVTVAGDVTVSDVDEVTLTPVPATPPKLTVEPVTNPVPVMVTEVPPDEGPVAVPSEVSVGATAV